MNVASYGADGNGITNDTTAIKSAVANNPNKVIYFPPGTYKVNTASGAIMLQNGQTLNMTGATLQLTTSEADNLEILRAYDVTNVTINGGTLRGDKADSASTDTDDGVGLRISNASGITVNGLTVEQIRGHGIHIQRGSDLTFTNVTASNNRVNGAAVVSGSSITFDQVTATGNGLAGIDLETESELYAVTDVVIRDCTLNGNVNGLQIDRGSTHAALQDVTVTRTTLNDNSGRGLSGRRGSQVTLTDSEANRNGAYGAYLELTDAYTLANCELVDNPTFDALWTNSGTTDGLMLNCTYDTLSVDSSIPAGEVVITS